MDKEMKDYMDVNQVVSQMESAFTGENTAYSRTVSETYSNHSNKNINLKKGSSFHGGGGEMMLYQQNSDVVTQERQKKNDKLKKKVQRLTGGTSTVEKDKLDKLLMISDSKDYSKDKDKDLFITGVSTKNNDNNEMSMMNEEEKSLSLYGRSDQKKKYYKYQEDELLDELDQHE